MKDFIREISTNKRKFFITLLLLPVAFMVNSYMASLESKKSAPRVLFMSMWLKADVLRKLLKSDLKSLHFKAAFKKIDAEETDIQLSAYAIKNRLVPLNVDDLDLQARDEQFAFVANDQKTFFNYEISREQLEKFIIKYSPKSLVLQPSAISSFDQDRKYKGYVVYKILPGDENGTPMEVGLQPSPTIQVSN